MVFALVFSLLEVNIVKRTKLHLLGYLWRANDKAWRANENKIRFYAEFIYWLIIWFSGWLRRRHRLRPYRSILWFRTPCWLQEGFERVSAGSNQSPTSQLPLSGLKSHCSGFLSEQWFAPGTLLLKKWFNGNSILLEDVIKKNSLSILQRAFFLILSKSDYLRTVKTEKSLETGSLSRRISFSR